MTTISTYGSTECPECGEEIPDIEVTVLFISERHPYGSTTATEHLAEIEESPDTIRCEDCGYRLTDQEVAREVERIADQIEPGDYLD